MHAAVLDLLDRHGATWAARPPVVAAVEALRAAHERVATLERERGALATTGLTADKATQRDAVEAAAMRLVRAVRPYARATGNRALEAEVDVSPSDLERGSDAALVGRAERVRAAAAAHLDALEAYGVTRADVAALLAAMEAFDPLGAARDATGAQREARTGALPGVLGEARAAVALLDDLVPGLGDDALTAEYGRARRTDDR